MLKRLVVASAFVAVLASAAPASAGPVGTAMCGMASSTCTLYGRADQILCPVSTLTCHM